MSFSSVVHDEVRRLRGTDFVVSGRDGDVHGATSRFRGDMMRAKTLILPVPNRLDRFYLAHVCAECSAEWPRKTQAHECCRAGATYPAAVKAEAKRTRKRVKCLQDWTGRRYV